MLVVEDDAALREVLVSVLEAAGYAALQASSGQEALWCLRESTSLPHVVVLDLHLPGTDGWEFRMHQQRDPAIAAVPVVIISGDVSPPAITMQSHGFVTKPIEPSALLAAVAAAADEAERERSTALDLGTSRLSSLATLASGVAHEVNNPLTCVLGNLQRLREQLGPREPTQRKLIEDAIEGAEQIRAVVRDLATFARPDRSTRKVMDVSRIVDAAVSVIATDLAARAQLERRYEDVAPIFANESRLAQVFLNVLMNAAQAIQPGRAHENSVTIAITPAGQENVFVSISDTGAGMAPSVLRRAFDPFFSTKRGEAGSGLGLWISYGIVQDHGGSIEIDSAVGSGTTVRLTLPTADAALRARSSRSATNASRGGLADPDGK